MASSVKRRATYDDLLQVPPHRVAEIVDGDMHATPRPASRHALASSRLGSELGPPFDRGRGGPGGWWILDEPELHFGEDVVVPDLAGWTRERLPSMPQEACRRSLGPEARSVQAGIGPMEPARHRSRR